MIDSICARLRDEKLTVARHAVVDYYVSLKTTPFVVLTGTQRSEHVAFARAVAEALVGPTNTQSVQVTSDAAWTGSTGEGSFYRSMLERFDALRLVEVFQEASAPGNIGKAYFVCLDGLTISSLDAVFSRFVSQTGCADGAQSCIPANLYLIAATDAAVAQADFASCAGQSVSIVDVPVHRAGSEEQSLHVRLGQWLNDRNARRNSLAPVQREIPPVGYQRVLIESGVRDVGGAWHALEMLLGDAIHLLRPSFALLRLLARNDVLQVVSLREAACYIVNSFDTHGKGLFVPDDSVQNAQIAFDMCLIQRLMHYAASCADGTRIDAELRAHRHTLEVSTRNGGTESDVQDTTIPVEQL